MGYVLRSIRKARWYRCENAVWLGEGECQADAFLDLQTKGNVLSLWFIADDCSNLEEVVSALASARERISNLDYALLDQKFITENDLQLQPVIGSSPNGQANTWHRDLVELSASKLCVFANMLFEYGEKRRFTERDVLRLLARAMALGHIDRSRLSMHPDDVRRIDQCVAETRPA